MISFRPPAASDYDAIREVLLAAFETPLEADLVEALRTEGCVVLELVAEAHAQVVGHILYSDLPIEGAKKTLRGAALAPMAIHPEWQNRGLGGGLIRMSLPMLAHQGVDAVVVLGHDQYYPRFGFSAELATGLATPYPPGPHLMAIDLSVGCLDGFTGRAQYARAFDAAA